MREEKNKFCFLSANTKTKLKLKSIIPCTVLVRGGLKCLKFIKHGKTFRVVFVLKQISSQMNGNVLKQPGKVIDNTLK